MVRVIRRALQGLLLLLAPTAAWAGLTLDVATSSDRSSSATTITTPAFTTASGNELLLAFVATDAKSAGITVTGVTGGGLEGPDHATNHRILGYHIKHSLSSSFLRPGVPRRAFWLLWVSAGIKVSRNHQSEANQVLGASSAGRRKELYSRLYRSWSLRIESQTAGS